MISFFFSVIGLIIILSIIHTVFLENIDGPTIPTSIEESDLWQDGETLKYYYHGCWHEAIAKDKNKVYIFDEINDQVVGVPFKEDI